MIILMMNNISEVHVGALQPIVTLSSIKSLVFWEVSTIASSLLDSSSKDNKMKVGGFPPILQV